METFLVGCAKRGGDRKVVMQGWDTGGQLAFLLEHEDGLGLAFDNERDHDFRCIRVKVWARIMERGLRLCRPQDRP